MPTTTLANQCTVLSFPDGREALPRWVAQRSDILRLVDDRRGEGTSLPGALPRDVFRIWSMHIQAHHQPEESVSQLCSLLKVCCAQSLHRFIALLVYQLLQLANVLILIETAHTCSLPTMRWGIARVNALQAADFLSDEGTLIVTAATLGRLLANDASKTDELVEVWYLSFLGHFLRRC